MGELVEKIRYELDETDVVRGHQKMQDEADETARENDQAADKSDRAWSRFAKGLETNADKMRKVGAAMTVGLTIPLGMFANASIDAARDAEESANKSRAVFGDWAAGMESWADGASESLRMGRTAAIEAAATFGNLFTSMEVGRQDAADMSQQVVELAADLASFNNIGADEALEKLRSGLVGEIEPLRALGVSFNAAQVEARALELGLADANGEVSEAAKVQARLALVLEMTKNAQGDAAATAGTLAGQEAELNAQMENLQETVGQRLVPAKLALVEAANGALGVFQALPGPVQDVAVGLGGVAAAAGPTLFAVGQMAQGMGALRDTIPKLRGALGNVGTFLTGPWGIALGAGVAALGVFATMQGDTKVHVDGLRESLDQQTGAITDNTRELAVNTLEQSGALEAAQQLGLELDLVTDAALGNEDAIQAVREAVQAASDAERQYIEDNGKLSREMIDTVQAGLALEETLGGVNTQLEGDIEATRRMADATGDAGDAADQARTPIGALGDDAEESAAQIRTLKDALDEQRAAAMGLANPLFAVLDAEQELADARAAATQAARDSGQGSAEHEQAMLDAARAAAEYDAELAGVLTSIRDGEGDVDQLRFMFERLRDQEFVDQESIDLLQRELEEVLGLAETINGTEAVLRVGADYSSPQIADLAARAGRGVQARAAGGPVSGGVPYLVGEEGPELYVPEQSGQIISFEETNAILNRIARASERNTNRPSVIPVAFDGSEDSLAALRLVEMAAD